MTNILNTPVPGNENALPIIPASGVYIHNANVVVTPARLRNTPRPQDPRLADNDPDQTWIDCRTIDGWMKFMTDLIAKAWSTGVAETQPLFTHDYGLLPEDPKALKGAIVVWEILSKVPAQVGKDGTREIKPRVREIKQMQQTVLSASSTAVTGTATPGGSSRWIWAQSFDVVMMFTVYGDTWGRMYEYLNKFEDFMTTYAGIFIQTGLQQLWYREQTRDALYDPPKTQAFPNKSVFYNARIEKQTPVDLAVIEQVLLSVGIIDPSTGTTGDQVHVVEAGVPTSPILPSAAPTT